MSISIKHRYFNKRKYLEADSTERQNATEEAIARHLKKRRTFGLMSVPLVTPQVGGFIYQISSQETDPLHGHDKNGLYVELDAEPYTTVDLAGEFTIPSAGNDKYLTLVLRFLEEQVDPQTDGILFTTVYFRREASFEIVVLEGTEAPTGTAVKPSLASEDGLYLSDILVTDSSTDANTTTVEFESARLTRDPIEEAVERGLDGISSIMALIGGPNGITLSDLNDVSVDEADAFNGMITPSALRHILVGLTDLQDALDSTYSVPSALNPMATLNDLRIKTFSTSQSTNTTGTPAPHSYPVPANSRYAILIGMHIEDAGGVVRPIVGITFIVMDTGEFITIRSSNTGAKVNSHLTDPLPATQLDRSGPDVITITGISTVSIDITYQLAAGAFPVIASMIGFF